MSFEIRDKDGNVYGIFGKDAPKFDVDNRTEGFLYCQFIALLKEASESELRDHPCLVGKLSSSEMNRRFGNFNPQITGEGKESSADYIIVNDNIVTMFNHFSIDASKPIYKKGVIKGTEYQRTIGANKDKPVNEIAKEAVKLEYSVKYWIDNLIHAYRKHEKKIENYYKNADKYFEESSNSNSSIDIKKTREMWFFIDDRTPNSYDTPKELFYALANLLEENRNVNGVFYIRNGNPTDIPRDYHSCLIIHNDELAIKGLRSGVVGT